MLHYRREAFTFSSGLNGNNCHSLIFTKLNRETTHSVTWQPRNQQRLRGIPGIPARNNDAFLRAGMREHAQICVCRVPPVATVALNFTQENRCAIYVAIWVKNANLTFDLE